MKHKLNLELIWWLFTLIVVVGIMIPIYSITESYYYRNLNVLFIVVFITLTRHIFLLPLTFISYREWLKIAIILLSPILIFLLIQEVNGFQTHIDQYGWEAVIGQVNIHDLNTLSKYIHTELLFFGVGSIISGILLPIRLLVSIWRIRNLGKD